MSSALKQECADLVRFLALHPRGKVPTDVMERVQQLVRTVHRLSCFFWTKQSVFEHVKDIVYEEFDTVPEYGSRQRELLEALDHCCLYTTPYKPMSY